MLKTKRAFIAHFRYATVGGETVDNRHPFKIGDTGALLYQNGSNYNLGNTKITDTEELADMLGMCDPQAWRNILEMTDSRYVIVDPKRKQYHVYNEDMFIDNKGGTYSKNNVLDHEIVAVYGTLKRGFSNNSVMGNSTYVASGKTMNKYPMVESGIPFVLPRVGEGHNIKVEVFMCTKAQLGPIDSLEGHPHNYCRKRTPVRLETGELVMAWLYFYPNSEYVDNGTYIDEYTRGYNPSSLSSGVYNYSYTSDHYSAFTCDCVEREEPQQKLWDEYDEEYYCGTCLGLIKDVESTKPF